MNILEACDDPALFAPWFRDPTTWRAWRAFLAALFGLEMDDEARGIYTTCTGRSIAPVAPFEEGWLVAGRRGGKTLNMALIAAFLGTFRDYRPFLAPGEVATIALIAADRRQARSLIRYLRGFLTEIPMLAQMVTAETREAFELGNRRVVLEVATASFKSTRGYSYAAVLADELAFWPSEDAANPDEEILAALRPGLASIPGSVLICASSPHAKRGELWRAFRQYHGRDDAPVLVWQAPTRTMNPSIPERVVAGAYARDPARAAAEYGAEFRTDVESYVNLEALEACVELECRERAPLSRVSYSAFVDPSGGSADSMTLAIVHEEGGDPRRLVLDATRERRAPFDPTDVVGEFAALLKGYNVRRVTGDRYAGEWPREAFRKHGIDYVPADRPKSDLYRDLLPLVNSRAVDLLDEPRLVAQLAGLERRTARGGRNSIDHAPGGHDDVANAVAGALVTAATARKNFRIETQYLRGVY